MITICFVIGQLSTGGTEKQLYELLKDINKKTFQPIVISLSEGGVWADEIRKLGIDVFELKRRKNIEFSRLFRLIKLFKSIKPAIVHCYLFSANSYGRLAAIINRIPIIIASERNLPEIGKDKKNYQIYIDKILSFFSDGIICNSQTAADLLINKYKFNKNKIFVIHNGINLTSLNYFPPKYNPTIGTVCRLSPQKNLRLFLDLARVLLEKKNDLKFLIVGDGPMRSELETYAKKLEIQKNIFFFGEQRNVFKFLKEMNVFVLTSLYEGLSNSIMEAMLSGLPVVATDVGGNRELIVDGETGFLCEPNNLSDMVEKVIYLINNPQEAKKMGEKGRKRIIDHFNSDIMITKIEELYLKLINSKKYRIKH